MGAELKQVVLGCIHSQSDLREYRCYSHAGARRPTAMGGEGLSAVARPDPRVSLRSRGPRQVADELTTAVSSTSSVGTPTPLREAPPNELPLRLLLVVFGTYPP
jgi:hypothetical protein